MSASLEADNPHHHPAATLSEDNKKGYKDTSSYNNSRYIEKLTVKNQKK